MAQIILDSNNNLIQGDFDNATLNNRTKLQTTTTNATTNVYVVPNGSATSAGYSVANNADPTNCSKIVMATNGTTDTQIISGINGSGTYLPLSFYTNNALAMQVGTSGNVGIGGAAVDAGEGKLNIASSTSPSSLHLFYGANGDNYYTCGTSGIQVFRTGSTERMRLDSSGNLLVGGTSAVGSSRLLVKGSGSSSATTNIYVQNSSGTDILYMRDDGAINTGTTTSSPYNLTTGSGANAVLGSDGFLRRSTSSIKYKTDVQNAVYGLNEVMQLRPVTYKGKNDGNKKFGGLIAEEVDEIGLTEFVEYAEDGTPDALSYGHMVSLLTKAIQEQQTIINELKTRIEALESK
jgi:hypothetical protein